MTLRLAAAMLLLLGAPPAAPAQPGASQNPLLLDTPFAPAGYERLLRDYVVVQPLPDGAYETRFDYARFWSRTDQAAWRENLRKRFLEARPEHMDAATRRAWAINAYNFLVIDRVMEALGDPERRLASIREIGEKPFAALDEPRYTVDGELYSLNGFENRFLFDGFDRKRGSKKKPPSLDPRLHFALVCAAEGSPPLGPRPYQPSRLDAQLDDAVRNALRSPRHLRAAGDTLAVSQIFSRYAPDFEPEGVRDFLLRYAPASAVQRLRGPSPPVIHPDLPWDWSLNRPR